jgi:protein-S-isoprenylcysteine O-methyltransferase Ste14
MSVFGSLLFAFLLVVRIAQMAHYGLDFLGLLLALQAGLASFLLIFRSTAVREACPPFRLFAWLSAILPLAMQTVTGWQGLLAVPGLLFSLWALWSLGSSFSIAPAARQLVERGPYKLIRHPMYTGEVLSLLGACITAFSLWNACVFVLFTATVYLRVMKEESMFLKYSIYAQFVKWRMIPGVW